VLVIVAEALRHASLRFKNKILSLLG
jgi:hypothetical protein